MLSFIGINEFSYSFLIPLYIANVLALIFWIPYFFHISCVVVSSFFRISVRHVSSVASNYMA